VTGARSRLALGALFIALAGARLHAQGGPPLITDDPDTPGPGYWEINLSSFFERHQHASTLEIPRIDANYGVGRRVQLKLEAPWVRGSENGTVRTGAGNATVGVKYRFVGQEGQTIAWSVYPQLEINTSRASAAKGLADEGRQLLLPSELTIEAFHVEINGEVGRNIVESGHDTWVYGLSTEGHVVPRLELVAELHGERRAEGPTELIANIGGREKLTRQVILMLAVGRAVRGVPEDRPRLLVYAGLQFNVPGLYSFKTMAR
jgi:hypothetical protein